MSQTKSSECGVPEPCAPVPGQFFHVGNSISHASREINCALDARISAQVSPELTGLRGIVLGFLMDATRDGCQVYQRDLESRFHTNRSSITAMLQGMEQSGFITREPVARDARLKSLVPTEKGRRCAQGLRQCIAGFERDLQKGITPAEIEQLQDTLHTLIENAKTIRSAGGKAV